MKTNIITLTLLSLMSLNFTFAQDRTTVTANNSEISDNLDLRAVASIFGDSKDLDDFEYRLNNPEYQISNLDLNNDNKVDYLRVIETVEGNTHLIVIQSVLGRDLFQDIATVEVMKDTNNRVQVQVVGDVYMYGTNYIYEPVYAFTPIIYSSFWIPQYRPYYSSWYWGYYPSYYVAWHPFPIFRYRSHINVWINFNHHYNYVNTRYCGVVYNNYYRGRRANAYELQHPNRSFSNRHNGYANRYELDKTRNIRTVGTRTDYAANNQTTRSISGSSRNDNNTRNSNTKVDTRTNDTRTSVNSTRNEGTTRTFAQNSIKNNGIKSAPSRNETKNYSSTRNNDSGKSNSSVRNSGSSNRSGNSVSNRGNSSSGSTRSNSRR